MNSRGGTPSGGAREPVGAAPVPAGDYRRLLAVLAARAKRLGSRDPESASQEALKRSLENASSRAAMEYYFAESTPNSDPDWELDHLLAWLQAVLHNVIREERSRVGYWREVDSLAGNGHATDFAHSSADPLEALMKKEMAEVFGECFGKLEREQREVLAMRARGMKYGEIAGRLGVNENTVATWISRGTRALGRLIRGRMGTPRGRDARWSP